MSLDKTILATMQLPPPEEHDPSLLDEAHPPDWQNPVPHGRYNLVAIGGGTAGLVSALGTAELGGRPALSERASLGGNRRHYGSVLNKAFLAAARAVYRTSLGDEFGFRLTGSVQSDFAAIMGRLRQLRADLERRDSAERLTAAGVDVYFGQARFTARDRIEVAGRELTFRRAVIASGGRPVLPDVPGIESIDCLTTETIFALSELPRRLLVIGGGPIGCELAQAFRRLGSEVHLVHRGERLLNKEEPDVSRLLHAQFEREGIHVHLGWSTEAAERVGDAKGLVIGRRGEKKKLLADAVLAAVGRRPNLEELGLEAAGVGFSANGVEVDDYLRTSNRAIYAAGDVCAAQRCGQAAEAMARLCLQNALFFNRRRLSKLIVPRCTHTDPQIAQVGLTASQAADRDIAIDTHHVELSEVDRALVDSEEQGLVMVHTRRGSGRVVGGTIVAAQADEMIGELTLLMRHGLSLSSLAGAIRCQSTLAEALTRIAEGCQHTRLTPFLNSLARRWLRWRR